MRARKRCYRNTSHQLPMAMERLVQRSQVMHDPSVTKAHCNELVRNSFENNGGTGLTFVFAFTANGPILQENEIWNVIIQLTCGLRAIHQANLACRFDNIFMANIFIASIRLTLLWPCISQKSRPNKNHLR